MRKEEEKEKLGTLGAGAPQTPAGGLPSPCTPS